MAERFGIGMGNSTVCLSVLKDGKIDIVASKFGDRCSYAVVSAANENELIIGLSAKQGLARNGQLTVVNNFQFLNEDLNDNDFHEAKQNCVCSITKDPLQYNLFSAEVTRTITPYEVAVKLFANAYENASQAAKSDANHEVVLAVPLQFSQESRKNVVSAAREAGFNVLQVVSEPAAALLAYEIGFDANEKSTVMVYRLGGLTSDVSIFNIQNGMYETIDHTRSNIGGNLLTKSLTEYMAKEFYQKYKLDPRESRRTMTKMAQHAETCKHILSTLQSAHVFIESLMDGVDWSQNISRARFENIIASQLIQLVRPIEELTSKHNGIHIDKIVLNGGSAKIPKLKSVIAAAYPTAEILDMIPGDEVIAMGCARQAMFINKSWDPIGEYIDMEVQTITNDITISDSTHEEKCIFPSGTIIPTETRVQVNSINGQIILNVKQGDDQTDSIERNVNDDTTNEHEIRAKMYIGHVDKNCKINFIFPVIDERLIN